MLLALQIILLALLVGILVYSLLTHFATSRTFKVTMLLIAAIASAPILALSIYAYIAAAQFGPDVKGWALAVGAVVVGFWLKTPFASTRRNASISRRKRVPSRK
jgi:hypothetical protein